MAKRIKKGSWMARKQALAHGYRKGLRAKATKAELVFQKKLKSLNVNFSFQRSFISNGGFCIVDFYFPGIKLCLEVDGGYHNNPEQQDKDERRTRYLEDVRGCRVVRITNEQAFKLKKAEVADLIGLNDPKNTLPERWPEDVNVGDTVRMRRRNRLFRRRIRGSGRNPVVREVRPDSVCVSRSMAGKKTYCVKREEYQLWLL